jgi:hypothetical protein
LPKQALQNDARYAAQPILDDAKKELSDVEQDGTIWGFCF